MTGALPAVVFMGTPDFAVPSLEALAEAGHPVRLVVTQPDRPRGRGRRLAPPPVRLAAERLGLPVIQPARLGDPPTIEALAAAGADLFVVVAFGQLLPPAVLDIPPLGAVNVHASLLPRHRGAAPIQWAILQRDAETGVTTMQMDAGLDTGDILLSEATPIGPRETAAALHDRLARMGARLVVATAARLAAGDLVPQPQDDARATCAPRLAKADGRIDWQRPALAIEALVRGFTPWPGAFTFMGDRRLKILAARPARPTADTPPGTVLPAFEGELRVMTGDGALSIEALQGAAGKPLAAADFLRGHPVPPGTRLG